MKTYTVTQSKDNITVTMVVDVDSTVKVGFLLTNNARKDCYVTIAYYDSLKNYKEWTVTCTTGDVNKSTGVLFSFNKPSFNLDCCFDIKNVEFVEPYPKPTITEIWQHSVECVCDYVADICWDAGQDYPLWRNGKQEYVPVFLYKNGFPALMGWSRSSFYTYYWSKLKVRVPPFGGGYQWASVDVGSVVNKCPDEFTYLRVYPSGGDYWVTDRRQRPRIEDYCFSWNKTVSLNVKNEYSGYLPHTPFEVTLKNSGKILAFDMWIVGFGAGVAVYQNGKKIAQLGTRNYMATIRGNFKAGDVIRIEVTGGGKGWIKDIKLIDYWFNDYSDTMSFRVIHRTWMHKVDIKAYGVPEEFADEFVAWLKSRGVNAVKIKPIVPC
jgi:hypothetical protein